MTEILTALALVMVIEGLLPAISPAAYKRAASQLASLPLRTIRITGLVIMVTGALILQLVR